jgi:transposase InsO family protein
MIGQTISRGKSAKLKSILRGSDVEILLTAHQAPNMNAYAERFLKSIKSECLDQMIFLA